MSASRTAGSFRSSIALGLHLFTKSSIARCPSSASLRPASSTLCTKCGNDRPTAASIAISRQGVRSLTSRAHTRRPNHGYAKQYSTEINRKAPHLAPTISKDCEGPHIATAPSCKEKFASSQPCQNPHLPIASTVPKHPIDAHPAAPKEKIKSAQSAANAVKALVEEDMQLVHKQIAGMFDNSDIQLQRCSYYYFDQQGKSIRPMIMLLMAKATSRLLDPSNPLYGVASDGQRTLALIAEMIHTSSLLHDDVIDEATTRRNKDSVNAVFGDTQAIYAGDYILAKAAFLLASLNDTEVVSIMSQILDDLVSGEFMQLQNKKEAQNNPTLRFELYLQKTYHKTASLLACGCRATVALVGHNQATCDRAYQYGKDIGMAFQVIDDVLDYVSSSEEMGKPTSADLKLGLATAPVLFAAEEYPELNKLIVRRFKAPGDVERARELVELSSGLEQSRALAQKYCDSAIATLDPLPPSPERDGLIALTNAVLNRSK